MMNMCINEASQEKLRTAVILIVIILHVPIYQLATSDINHGKYYHWHNKNL